MAAWVARLVSAQKVGMDVVLNIRIFGDGDTIDVPLTYSMVDANVNMQRIKDDIAHYARSLGKWPKIQAKIGSIISSGNLS